MICTSIATHEILIKIDVFELFKMLTELIQNIFKKNLFFFHIIKFLGLVNNLHQFGRHTIHTAQMRDAKNVYLSKKTPYMWQVDRLILHFSH